MFDGLMREVWDNFDDSIMRIEAGDRTHYILQTNFLPLGFHIGFHHYHDAKVHITYRHHELGQLVSNHWIHESIANVTVDDIMDQIRAFAYQTPWFLVQLFEMSQEDLGMAEWLQETFDMDWYDARSISERIMTILDEEPNLSNYEWFCSEWDTSGTQDRFDGIRHLVPNAKPLQGTRLSWAVVGDFEKKRIFPTVIDYQYDGVYRPYQENNWDVSSLQYDLRHRIGRFQMHPVEPIDIKDAYDQKPGDFTPVFDGYVDMVHRFLVVDEDRYLNYSIEVPSFTPLPASLGILSVAGIAMLFARIPVDNIRNAPVFFNNQQYVYTHIESCTWWGWENLPSQAYPFMLQFNDV